MPHLHAFLAALIVFLGASRVVAESKPLHYGGCWLREADGRYFNPKGFVVVMEDNVGRIEYKADDYRRMVRYGANTQVIRIGIGVLAGLDGAAARESYLQSIDTRVRLGKQAGLHTIFKMTVYGLKGFDHRWETIYRADGEHRQHLFDAWDAIWQKYATEPSVVGFDLLNEPYCDQSTSPIRTYDDVTRNSLIPLHTTLIKQMAAICPDKWAIYQPLLVSGKDRVKTGDGFEGLPMWHMQMPHVYDRMIYAPHGYFAKSEQHAQAVKLHQKEAAASDAALMMGEWGRQTYMENDTNLAAQLECTRLYAEVAHIFDAAGMGLTKAWFHGDASGARNQTE